MVLEFYYDLLSQPCRAVYLFLKGAGVEFEHKLLDILKGEHYQPEFTKKNPYHKVPVIDDDGFVLSESVAIMRYVAIKHNVAQNWYPRDDVQKQSRVDEFLSWQHLCIRKPALDIFIGLFRSRIGVGHFTKQPYDPVVIDKARQDIKNAVKHIDEYFLGDKPFIAGDEISAADLLGVCELIHLEGVEEDELYKTNEKVYSWIKRVADKMQPHFDEAGLKLNAMKEKYVSAKE